MKAEFRIREVTRYVITRHDECGTNALVQVDSRSAAEEILSALQAQEEARNDGGETSVFDLPISKRVAGYLQAQNVFTISDLCALTRKEVGDFTNIGKRFLAEIELAIEPFGGLKS